MRTILLPLALAGCVSTRPSTFFHDVAAEAPAFLARSAPQTEWADRLRTEPEPAGEPAAPPRNPPRLPASQVLAFESGEPLPEAEVKELFERLEVEIVRALFKAHARVVSRHEREPRDHVRAVSWEYGADDRRGVVALFGVGRKDGYEVVIDVCEMGIGQ